MLEKKMNKWIKIFEQSEREGNNRDTEQAKRQHELQVALERLEKLSGKNQKAVNVLEARVDQLKMNLHSDIASSKNSTKSKRKKRSGLASDDGSMAGGGIGEATGRGRGRGRACRPFAGLCPGAAGVAR